MSVVQSKREESLLTVITKANELATYTIHICSNEKHFPKRYRWCITDKIVDATLELNNNIVMANAIYVNSDKDLELRRAYQNKAIAASYSLLSMIDISYRVFHIESARIKYWTELIVQIQALLRNWRKSDSERYKK